MAWRTLALGLSRAWLAAASPTAGPLYGEYQAPIELHNRFFVGALIALTGLIAGGFLLVTGRRRVGLLLGGVLLLLGLTLAVSERFGLF